jgi:hypothetical protein
MPFISQPFAVRANNEILALDASVTLCPLFSLVKHEGVTSTALKVHLCLRAQSKSDNKTVWDFLWSFFSRLRKKSTRVTERRNSSAMSSIWPKTTPLMTMHRRRHILDTLGALGWKRPCQAACARSADEAGFERCKITGSLSCKNIFRCHVIINRNSNRRRSRQEVSFNFRKFENLSRENLY